MLRSSMQQLLLFSLQQLLQNSAKHWNNGENQNVSSARHWHPILLRGSQWPSGRTWMVKNAERRVMKLSPWQWRKEGGGAVKWLIKKTTTYNISETLKTETLTNCNVQWAQNPFQGQYKRDKNKFLRVAQAAVLLSLNKYFLTGHSFRTDQSARSACSSTPTIINRFLKLEIWLIRL